MSVVGDIVTGKVTRITNFGAFVDLGNGESGLIHISEIADVYVKDVNDYLQLGQEVQTKVISAESPRKISLSLKSLTADREKPAEKSAASSRAESSRETAGKKSAAESFEDKLARFMQDSNERQVLLKRHQEGKKGR